MKKLIYLIFISAFVFLIFLSIKNMSSIPFHDFDEANRAEGARNMKLLEQYLGPITGSPFLRNEKLKIKNPFNNNWLYFHLERPPLFFLSMILSTKIFGESELAYRLPSFIFGIGTILIIFVFFLHYQIFKNKVYALLSLIPILTAKDWWLSSQSALMDTMLSFFLTLAIINFLIFLRKGKNKRIFLIFSGVSWGLAFLSKGQPSIIFVFPLFFLLIFKRLTLKEGIIIFISFLTVISPWILLVIRKFGLTIFLETFVLFAKNRTLAEDITQKAPIFWYFRWWFESFRIGVILFVTFLFLDLKTRKISLEKLTLIFFIIPSFIFFSLAKNKVWWYVLPLIPSIILYIGLSINEMIKRKNKLINFLLIIFISGLPLFYQTTNKIALIFSFFLILISLIICQLDLPKFNHKFFIVITTLIVFLFFYKNFPIIKPTYKENKIIGEYFQTLKNPKCLYVDSMPYEAIMFYSRVGEINYLNTFNKDKKCENYLVSPKDNPYQLIKKSGILKLYKIIK